jgi:hypothetical protein
MFDSRSVWLIVLTGFPATGKTCVGNYLADYHGFRHLDFEIPRIWTLYWQYGERGFRKQVRVLKQQGQDVVVSWGFVPDTELDAVLLMQSLGFEWVWFDGDREAAHRSYRKRGAPPGVDDSQYERNWQVQIGKIDTYLDLETLHPRTIDPFDSEGQHLPIGVVANEVLRA